MIQTKVRIAPLETGSLETQPAIPVSIPDIEEIRQFANELHVAGIAYEGEMGGWPVQYEPELPEPPLDSRLTFTPAFFWIGVWPIWYVSFTWEAGRSHEPSMLTGEENLVA